MKVVTKKNFASVLTKEDIALLNHWYDMAHNLSCVLNTQGIAIANAYVNCEITDWQRTNRLKFEESMQRLIIRIEQDVLTIKDLLGQNIEWEALGLTPDHVSDRVFNDITDMLNPMTKIVFGVPVFGDDGAEF